MRWKDNGGQNSDRENGHQTVKRHGGAEAEFAALLEIASNRLDNSTRIDVSS